MDDLKHSDSGYYTCKGTNSGGESETTGVLIVKNGVKLFLPVCIFGGGGVFVWLVGFQGGSLYHSDICCQCHALIFF